MKSVTALEKQDNGTIKLTITIPYTEAEKVWHEVEEQAVKNADLPGFRKGKAPQKLVVEKLNKETLREETLKKLLPTYYLQAIEEHRIKPAMHPRIQIEEAPFIEEKGDTKDWKFVALTCEVPAITLDDYKKKIKDITAKAKIVIPGKEQQPVPFDQIMQALMDSAQTNIPHLLVEQEAERQLSQLLEDIKKLGLSLDQYMQSTSRTPEALRDEYHKKAEQDIKVEFVLQKVAEEEKITVEEKELTEAIHKAKDEKEKQHLEANKYLLASIIRQQKTLDFLKNL